MAGDGQAVTLDANIIETVFRNEENGYTVLNVQAGRERFAAVGVMPPLTPGEQARFTGQWTEHPQYGRQLKADTAVPLTPSTRLGMERYLGSGLIKGMGPATAKIIVDVFGLDAMNVLSDHPERLTSVPGIGRKRAAQIAKSFAEQYGIRQSMLFLQAYGIPASLAVRVSRYYGTRTQEVVTSDPYRLVADIEGVGFPTADGIAAKLGMARDHPSRVMAGIRYALTSAAMADGHVYLPKEELLARCRALLSVPDELTLMQIQALTLQHELRMRTLPDGVDAVYLKNFFIAELDVASRVTRMLRDMPVQTDNTLSARIQRVESAQHIELDEQQREAVRGALTHGVYVITGGPGTGKTTILRCLLQLLDEKASVKLCAPTGRAAKRMTESAGQAAFTIHRLLEYGGDNGQFAHNEDHPLQCDWVIVDEMSMVDLFLMRALLRALSEGTRLILVGDADQLPSVGPGNVLHDILESGVVPCTRLTRVFRQAENSLIIKNAHQINEGKPIVLRGPKRDLFFERQSGAEQAADAIIALVASRLPAFMASDNPITDIQALSPAKKGACGVWALNRRLQDALNPSPGPDDLIKRGDTEFRRGDKVIHIKNNYALEWTGTDGEEGKGVFNGDMGIVDAVNAADRTLTILFDDGRLAEYEYAMLEELELAYCLSVHKSQGSEYPCVVLPVIGGSRLLCTRNLLYTALTRARDLCVLVGREDCVAEMIANNLIRKRYTTLAECLKEGCMCHESV